MKNSSIYGLTAQKRNGVKRTPAWSATDLAERFKVTRNHLYGLLSADDAPAPISSTFHSGHTVKLYDLAEVTKWWKAMTHRQSSVANE